MTHTPAGIGRTPSPPLGGPVGTGSTVTDPCRRPALRVGLGGGRFSLFRTTLCDHLVTRSGGGRYGATRPFACHAAYVSGISSARCASIFSATISISRCGNDG